MPSPIRLAPNPLHDSGDEQQTETCPWCEGDGEILDFDDEWDIWQEEQLVPCPDCAGTGRVDYWQEARR